MIKKEDVFKIGQFAKPHGIKGEIALVTNSDVFDDSDDPYIICEMDGILVPFFIEEYRYKTDTVILLKLKNVDDENHNGEELLLPAAEELILSADHENKTLAVSVPEGLLDL